MSGPSLTKDKLDYCRLIVVVGPFLVPHHGSDLLLRVQGAGFGARGVHACFPRTATLNTRERFNRAFHYSGNTEKHTLISSRLSQKTWV